MPTTGHEAAGRPRTRGTGRTRPDGGQEPDTVVVQPEELGDTGTAEEMDIGGVLLAAGPGERFEGPFKLLQPVEGEPMVRKAASALVESSLSAVVTVVGHEADAVREALSDLNVETVENTNYRDGQSTSVHMGVEMARERDWDAAVFGLGDMPFVTPETVDLVAQTYREGHGSIVAAGFDGKRGNPTLFDAEYYPDLMAVTGDTGGRPVLMSSPDVALVETGDPGVLRDIDTREDYDAYS